MDGDGHAGGKLYLRPKGKVACRKFYYTDRKLPMIMLTSLNGQPSKPIVIIQGTKYNRSAEIGIGILFDPEDNPEDPDFFTWHMQVLY